MKVLKKSKFKYGLGSVVRHKSIKGMHLIIARMEVEHICGAKDIQYYARGEDGKVIEIGQSEIKSFVK